MSQTIIPDSPNPIDGDNYTYTDEIPPVQVLQVWTDDDGYHWLTCQMGSLTISLPIPAETIVIENKKYVIKNMPKIERTFRDYYLKHKNFYID